jgi:hypothetical protein
LLVHLHHHLVQAVGHAGLWCVLTDAGDAARLLGCLNPTFGGSDTPAPLGSATRQATC